MVLNDGNQQIILVEGEVEMDASGMGITVNIGDSFQIIGTIIAAVISAIALLKSSNSNSSDRISRAQWAFEMYISLLGIYLSSTSEEDYKKYNLNRFKMKSKCTFFGISKK